MATEEEMMMEEAMMGERPPLPSMEGANMPPMEGANQDLLEGMPPEARGALMEPDEEIEIVLMSRIANMSPEDLALLDRAITPDVAQVLMKVLPELGEIIDKVQGEMQEPMMQEPPMGALGGMQMELRRATPFDVSKVFNLLKQMHSETEIRVSPINTKKLLETIYPNMKSKEVELLAGISTKKELKQLAEDHDITVKL